MKKATFFCIGFLISIITYSQIPNYYNDVNLNLSGQDLKDELAVKIISTHTNFLTYTPEVWDALKQSDLDPTDPNKVILIYGYDDTDGVYKTDRTRDKDQNGGGVGLWNREHVYPKSLGNPNLGTTGPGSDAHHLRPSDGQMNSSRSNRMFADGSGNSAITPQGHWYPGDEFKGDVARMMMYMYLRYDSVCLPINVGIGNAVAGDNNMVDLFLQWNVEDPVDFFEDNRNEVLGGIQGNRNPFIDNPAFATQIWGGPQAEDRFGTGSSDTEAPSIPASLLASNTTATATMLSWSASSDNVGVVGYDIYQDNTLVTTVTSTSYNVSDLQPDTMYDFYVTAKDQAGNISGNSNVASIITLTNGAGPNASELFISEYIEGSSNNKALEIANFTGQVVDLSVYALKKATNGSGSFSSTFSLSGQLADGDVYVVANSSATSAILNVADATNGGVMTFNGNDAIALFKNDVLIDKMGDENSSANYAQNVTLRRKSTIVNPNTLYVVSEWDSFSTDTFDDLGAHTIDGGSPADTMAPSIPTNIVASNITQTSVDLNWTSSTDDTAVTGYNIYQNGISVGSSTSVSYSVSGLSADTGYSFTVSAFDAAGNESAESSAISVTTFPAPDTTPPSAPSSLIASNIMQTTLDLSWNASTDNVGVTDYEVSQNGFIIATVTNTNYAVSGLTADTMYSFSVVALDEAGNASASSNIITITTESIPSGSTTVLSESYFESGWDGWQDGGGDCYRYSGSRSYEESYSIRIRDNSGSSSAMTSPNYDLASYDEVEVSFYFYSWSMENGEDFWLRYNDGSGWTTVETWARGTDFDNNNFYQATVTMSALDYSLVNGAQFRFQADASGNRDHIYIDQVIVSGIINGPSARGTAPSSSDVNFISYLNTDNINTFEEDFKLYPNPVRGSVLNIQLAESADNTAVTYRVMSLLGQEVANGYLRNEVVNVSNLQAGMYIIEINDGEDIMTQRFIKQ